MWRGAQRFVGRGSTHRVFAVWRGLAASKLREVQALWERTEEGRQGHWFVSWRKRTRQRAVKRLVKGLHCIFEGGSVRLRGAAFGGWRNHVCKQAILRSCAWKVARKREGNVAWEGFREWCWVVKHQGGK